MNPSTIFVLVVVAAAAFLSLRHLWKNRGRGCAGCAEKSACHGSCSSCHGCKEK